MQPVVPDAEKRMRCSLHLPCHSPDLNISTNLHVNLLRPSGWLCDRASASKFLPKQLWRLCQLHSKWLKPSDSGDHLLFVSRIDVNDHLETLSTLASSNASRFCIHTGILAPSGFRKCDSLRQTDPNFRSWRLACT